MNEKNGSTQHSWSDTFYIEAEKGLHKNGNLEDAIWLQDIQHRRIFITEEIDDSSIQQPCEWIMRYNLEDNGVPKEERKPILLYIDTCGGAVDAGLKLIDTILLSETEVRVICAQRCYSMGFYIFLAGHKRYASKHASFLLHDGTTFTYDSASKARDRMEFERKLEDRIRDYVLERSNITGEEYDSNMRKEWYMFSDEAKERGVVDFIIGEDCTIEEVC